MTFKDHFSGHADRYAQYRPDYPPALFTFLAGLTTTHTCAWDCGTGNGQAARALAAHFDRVWATDASAKQIEQARPHPRVRYTVAPAERSGLPTASADLITVAQALHWFDADAFLTEALRVGKPGGVLAAWSYEMATINPQVDAVVMQFYRTVVGPYWPPERQLVEDGYSHLTLPGKRLPAPAFAMVKDWRVEDVLGYVGTWSAVKNYRKANGEDPVETLEKPLEAAWGNAMTQKVSWPMQIHLSRLPDT